MLYACDRRLAPADALAAHDAEAAAAQAGGADARADDAPAAASLFEFERLKPDTMVLPHGALATPKGAASAELAEAQ